jgi:hypothetical protein
MRNPFRYFNTSPEVIRLTVLIYVRYPLSLRLVEDRLFETWDRYLSRDGAVLVEPVRSDVRRGDPQAAGSKLIILELALAPGRGVCPDQRRDALSLAGC